MNEVWPIAEVSERKEWFTFRPYDTVGQVSCTECAGSGWWGYGPHPEVNGPCIPCKGTGRVFVGLL